MEEQRQKEEKEKQLRDIEEKYRIYMEKMK